ncbi:MAG: BlaI/MecI/CopY family transcriptional regulator [Capsulimonadaceae bacterium]
MSQRGEAGQDEGYMGKLTGLGDQELEVLRYVTDHAPVTVREVAEMFGEPKGLARTTILTMMARLSKKGFLNRRKTTSAFEYVPAVSKQDLMRNLVEDFVQRTLDGSLAPFVAYLTEQKGLSEREVADLKEFIQEMESDGGQGV